MNAAPQPAADRAAQPPDPLVRLTVDVPKSLRDRFDEACFRNRVRARTEALRSAMDEYAVRAGVERAEQAPAEVLA